MNVSELMVEPVVIDKNDYISHAIEKMEKEHTAWIVVTNSGEPYGVMGYRDLGRELGSVKKMDLPASALHVSTAARKIEATLSGDDDVSDAAARMLDLGVGMLPVEDDGDVVGMLREEELLSLVESTEPVSTIMRETIMLSPDDRLVHARELMQDNDSWRLPVVESGRLVGMLTETDVAKAMKNFRDLVPGDQQDVRVRKILVEDVMSTDLSSCSEETPIGDARDTMIDKGVGGLPVLDADGDLAGVVTRADVAKLLL